MEEKEKFATETVRVRWEGLTPLLQHNPRGMDQTDPTVKELAKLTKKRNTTDDDLFRIKELEMELALYWQDKIGVYVPSRAIKGTIAAGATRWRKGTTVKKSASVNPLTVPLEYDGPKDLRGLVTSPECRDVNRVVVGMGSSIERTRPKFFPWSVEFDFQYLLSEFNFDQVQDFMDFAGLYRGLGDGRMIDYGRFEVTKFEKVKNGNGKRKRKQL